MLCNVIELVISDSNRVCCVSVVGRWRKNPADLNTGQNVCLCPRTICKFLKNQHTSHHILSKLILKQLYDYLLYFLFLFVLKSPYRSTPVGLSTIISSIEAVGEDDESYQPESTITLTSTSSSDDEGEKDWHEKKLIVNESSLGLPTVPN